MTPLIVVVLLGFNFGLVISYCGFPLACLCQHDIVICQGMNLMQIPFFTKLQRKNVVHLNVRYNKITHPRGDLFKSDWPFLETIDLRENPADCRSNFTNLQKRFSILTDNCEGNFIFVKSFHDIYFKFVLHSIYILSRLIIFIVGTTGQLISTGEEVVTRISLNLNIF